MCFPFVNGIRMLNVECARRMDIYGAIVEDNDIEECESNCDVGHDSDANSSNSELEGGHLRPKLTVTAIVSTDKMSINE
jgi:hypothetical protein